MLLTETDLSTKTKVQLRKICSAHPEIFAGWSSYDSTKQTLLNWMQEKVTALQGDRQAEESHQGSVMVTDSPVNMTFYDRTSAYIKRFDRLFMGLCADAVYGGSWLRQQYERDDVQAALGLAMEGAAAFALTLAGLVAIAVWIAVDADARGDALERLRSRDYRADAAFVARQIPKVVAQCDRWLVAACYQSIELIAAVERWWVRFRPYLQGLGAIAKRRIATWRERVSFFFSVAIWELVEDSMV